MGADCRGFDGCTFHTVTFSDGVFRLTPPSLSPTDTVKFRVFAYGADCLYAAHPWNDAFMAIVPIADLGDREMCRNRNGVVWITLTVEEAVPLKYKIVWDSEVEVSEPPRWHRNGCSFREPLKDALQRLRTENAVEQFPEHPILLPGAVEPHCSRWEDTL